MTSQDPAPEAVVTGLAQRDAWWARRTPDVEQVRPGLWSVPLPHATSGIRYVLSYVVEHDEGVGVVDPGWADEQSWEALVDGLRRAGRTLQDVTSIVVTHAHPDHLGGAVRLRDLTGAPVLLHGADEALLADVRGNPDGIMRTTGPWLVQHGCSDEDVRAFYSDVSELVAFSAMAHPDAHLADGDPLPWPGRDWVAVHTPGHTPGHLCLHGRDERVLLSGDHLLPRITPTVSAFPANGPDPLAHYLLSLDRAGALDVDEVLPAHEWRFTGLADRSGQVLEHHHAREAEIVALLSGEPRTGAELATMLTWSRPWDEIQPAMRRVAVGETVAHLQLLQTAGRAYAHGGSDRVVWTDQP